MARIGRGNMDMIQHRRNGELARIWKKFVDVWDWSSRGSGDSRETLRVHTVMNGSLTSGVSLIWKDRRGGEMHREQWNG
jgi:hypothetical protein